MNYLLDTNIVSEGSKEKPNERVLEWMYTADTGSLWLSVVTLFEVRSGAERLTPSRKKQELERWIENELKGEFHGRILGIDGAVAEEAGRISGQLRRKGQHPSFTDVLIAATARVHDMTLATLDKDFEKLGVQLVRF